MGTAGLLRVICLVSWGPYNLDVTIFSAQTQIYNLPAKEMEMPNLFLGYECGERGEDPGSENSWQDRETVSELLANSLKLVGKTQPPRAGRQCRLQNSKHSKSSSVFRSPVNEQVSSPEEQPWWAGCLGPNASGPLHILSLCLEHASSTEVHSRSLTSSHSGLSFRVTLGKMRSLLTSVYKMLGPALNFGTPLLGFIFL